ncbi:hypothetical protein Malapachy_1402 [Malassezia pachydermatis]|uniref:Uncharacterized protein n=1 Tax=Malassezia pachydermatis TaxID=77020 RepID=A0A0M8MS53_9BASI|nr:hypothetical protein Malapachy_1402 [Malassezia pachydermatis]KOS12690.1 hypothetical protein Malapachy_1402 [Malassezia pachydermatis]
MDLSNLRESLESSSNQNQNVPSRIYDEMLTAEFRGRKNIQGAFLEGYTKAIRDVIDCLPPSASMVEPEQAQVELDRLRDYLVRRLEALQGDAQEQEDTSDARHMSTTETPTTLSLHQRRAGDQRHHSEQNTTNHGGASPRTSSPTMERKHMRKPTNRRNNNEPQCASESPAPPPSQTQRGPDRPRKRRRPIRPTRSNNAL